MNDLDNEKVIESAKILGGFARSSFVITVN